MTAADYMFVLFLALIAFITHHARDRYFAPRTESYSKIMIGVGLWLTMMLVRTLGKVGLIPGVNSDIGQVYHSLAEALLLVAGGLLVGIGVIEWWRYAAPRIRRRTAQVDRKGQKEDLIRQIMPRLAVEVISADRLRDQMFVLDKALRQHINYDILRVAVYDGRGLNVTQYCLGSGRNLLAERDKSISTNKTLLGQLFAEPRVVQQYELAASQLEDDRWLAGCGAIAAITIPIQIGRRAIGAVTFAAAEADLSWLANDNFVAALRSLMTPLVHAETLQEELVSYNRRLLDMTATLKTLVGSGDDTDALKSLLETLVRKLPTTYGRLWSCDPEMETLTLIADAGIRDLGSNVAQVWKLSLSEAACHKRALQSGRLMIINQEKSGDQMDEHEMRLGLISNAQSALLIPLYAGDRPVGLLSLAEMRSWERRNFSLPETLFARGMANLASLTMVSSSSRSDLRSLNDRVRRLREQDTVNRVFTRLPQRLATPLTSIIARAGQLAQYVPEEAGDAARNLDIIRRQAEAALEEIRELQETREQVFS